MSEKVIAYTGSDKNMTVYSLNVFKGRKLLDVRKCYKNSNEDLVHTKKGISLSEKNFEDHIKIIKQHEKTISNWFADKESERTASEKISSYTSDIRDSNLRKHNYSNSIKETNTSYFFSVVTNPEGKELVINKEHNFYNRIESLDDNSKNILFDILMSLNQAYSLYDGDQKISTDELIDDINYTWSKILSNYCSSNE